MSQIITLADQFPRIFSAPITLPTFVINAQMNNLNEIFDQITKEGENQRVVLKENFSACKLGVHDFQLDDKIFLKKKLKIYFIIIKKLYV